MWTRSRRFRSVCVSYRRWSLRWGVSPCHGGERQGKAREGEGRRGERQGRGQGKARRGKQRGVFDPRKGEFGVSKGKGGPCQGARALPQYGLPLRRGDWERGDPPLAGLLVSLLPPSEGLPDRPTFRNSGLLGENINVDALAAFSFRVRLARTLVPSMGGFSISWRGEKERRGNLRSAVSLRDWKAFREYSRGLSASWVPFSFHCGFDRPSPVRAIDVPVIRDGSSLAGSWGPRSFCFRPIAVGPFDAAAALSDPSGKRGGG
jgi:hypothetical protein